MQRLFTQPLRASTSLTRLQLRRTMASFPEYVRTHYLFFSHWLDHSYCSNFVSELFQNQDLYKPLAQVDPEVQNIIDKETWRQWSGLELIASEVRLSDLAPYLGLFTMLLLCEELDQSSDDGSQRFHPHEQVL